MQVYIRVIVMILLSGVWASPGIARGQVGEGLYNIYLGPDKKLHSITQYRGENKDGVYFDFFNSGEVLNLFGYNNDLRQGYANTYYENGGIKYRRYFDQGRLSGPAYIYYSEGGIKTELSFLDNRLDGHIRHYSRQGQLTREDIYRQGKLLRVKKFDSQGEVLQDHVIK